MSDIDTTFKTSLRDRALFAYFDHQQAMAEAKEEQVEQLAQLARDLSSEWFDVEDPDLAALEFTPYEQSPSSTPPKMGVEFELEGLKFRLYLTPIGDHAPRLDYKSNHTWMQVKSLADLGRALK